MSIIKIKNSSDNTWMDVLGIPGKSAYKIALENGYTGTEIEFGDSLKKMAQTDLTNYDTAYTHSQSSHAPSNAQKNSDITKAEIETKLAGTITSHNHSGIYEPVITTKNTAFNVNFDGTASNIKMNGTQSLGSLSTVARADHIHPSDTTRVATTRTINSKPLSSDITLTLDDIANGTTRSLDNYSLSTHNHDTNYTPLAHTSDTTTHITASERTSWNAKSDFDGNYNSLNNKPILYLTGTEASPIVLWKLNTGFYAITGYIKLDNDYVTNVTDTIIFSICNYKLSETIYTISALCLNDIIATYYNYNYNKANETIEFDSSIVLTESYLDYILNNIVTTNIVGTTLTLTTNKYQKTTMVTGTTIVLPTVTTFTEIHLFFDTTTDLTLSLPSCKWQTQPTITANKSYELIFTYNGLSWLGGCISYE